MEFLQFIQSADESVALFFNSVSSDLIDNIMLFFSIIEEGGVIWILTLIAFAILSLTKKIEKKGFYVAVSVAIAILSDFIFTMLLKKIVVRPRPFVTLEEIKIIIDIPSGTSFPSAHSSTAFASAVALFFTVPRKKIYNIISFIAVTVASCVALSRVYLCVHYLSDVIVGVAVGIAVGLISSYFVNRFYNMRNRTDKINSVRIVK